MGEERYEAGREFHSACAGDRVHEQPHGDQTEIKLRGAPNPSSRKGTASIQAAKPASGVAPDQRQESEEDELESQHDRIGKRSRIPLIRPREERHASEHHHEVEHDAQRVDKGEGAEDERRAAG